MAERYPHGRATVDRDGEGTLTPATRGGCAYTTEGDYMNALEYKYEETILYWKISVRRKR
ncbi:MAG: hypothetical protein ACLTZT_08610 [Butyricimonas faecalis]